jgi:hypothetical protein
MVALVSHETRTQGGAAKIYLEFVRQWILLCPMWYCGLFSKFSMDYNAK